MSGGRTKMLNTRININRIKEFFEVLYYEKTQYIKGTYFHLFFKSSLEHYFSILESRKNFIFKIGPRRGNFICITLIKK
jgi:hypothetical protein